MFLKFLTEISNHFIIVKVIMEASIEVQILAEITTPIAVMIGGKIKKK